MRRVTAMLRRGYGLLALAVFLLDRASKIWAASGALDHPRIVLPGILRFAYVQNTGAAFGFLQGRTSLLAAITAAVLLALLVGLCIWGARVPPVARCALWVMLGAGVGNLWDRVFYGYVVDFIQVLFVRFPVFNIADACMVLSTLVLSAWILLDQRRTANGR